MTQDYQIVMSGQFRTLAMFLWILTHLKALHKPPIWVKMSQKSHVSLFPLRNCKMGAIGVQMQYLRHIWAALEEPN